MKLHHLTLALGLTALVAACEQTSLGTEDRPAAASSPLRDDSPVVATVNGTPLTERMLAVYQQQRHSRRPSDPAGTDREAVLEELISLELARQAAIEEGLQDQPDVVLQIDQQQRAVLAAAAIQKALQANPIAEEELRKLYDENVDDSKEYRARHILVEDQERARQLIAELGEGADFSELAKEHSTGPSGKAGGDLGWFSAGQMVAPFADALEGMEKGTYTKEPVETRFGWHVIMLDDTREASVPAYEQVKSQLRMMAQNQLVQNYVAELRRDADIKITLPDAPAESAASEAPAQPAPDSTAEDAGQTGGVDAGPADTTEPAQDPEKAPSTPTPGDSGSR